MSKCYGYIRVSTKYQVKEGLSLEFQEKAIRLYAKANNLELIDIIEDKGKSGRSMRENLKDIIDIMKKGDILLFYSISRLIRKAKDYQDVKAELERKGCNFKSVSENFDTTTSLGKALGGISAVLAELESDTTSERVKEGMKMKKEKGERLGRIPYGWKLSKGKGSDLIEHPEQQEVIRKIKNMKSERTKVKDIIKYLEDNNISPPKTSKKWYPCTIDYIVKRETVNTKGREIKE